VIIEFLADDVDGAHQNLAGFVEDFVNEPATMPWGNRSLLFRDPDGNLVNFVTPASVQEADTDHGTCSGPPCNPHRIRLRGCWLWPIVTLAVQIGHAVSSVSRPSR